MKSSEFEGCQDHACLIQKPKQGTNGGRCRCSHAKIEAYINALKEERAIVDEIRALEWVYWGGKPMCPLCCRLKHEGHESDCKIVTILRRLNGKT